MYEMCFVSHNTFLKGPPRQTEKCGYALLVFKAPSRNRSAANIKKKKCFTIAEIEANEIF